VILKRQKEKSNRSLKVAETIRKAVSAVLVRNELPVDPPFIFPLSVIKVEMNTDLKIAYIYVTTHEKIKKIEILNKLEECKKYLALEVVKLIDLKFSPKLIFRNDETIDQVNKIDQILNSQKVLVDIQKK
tara:strand:- start:219 stop:608 length:390 start_codon:yes stop_codon:yes gene_type:complete